jgi:Ca2+-transporting ATPase
MPFNAQQLCQLSIEEAFKSLNTTPGKGLLLSEITELRKAYGLNCLTDFGKPSLYKILLHQFSTLPIIVLLIAATISGVIGEMEDSLVILAIIAINGGLGFSQEYRAERAMDALRKLTIVQSRVLRDGTWITVPAEDLVPGDIVSFQAGDKIPADVRLLDIVDLEIDESMLTGESYPNRKSHNPHYDQSVEVSQMSNIAFNGTTVTRGRGTGLVFSTGMSTEVGRIAGLLNNQNTRPTPLQARLAKFSQKLALAVVGLCIIIFISGLIRGANPLSIFMVSLSLAVAAIPEALPAVTTVLLSLGAKSMAKHQALTRKLHAVETLGSVTFICTDKTGTLTENKLRLTSIAVEHSSCSIEDAKKNPARYETLLQVIALNNDATVEDGAPSSGDPLEVALLEGASALGVERVKLIEKFARKAEIPFSSERMMMSTLHANDTGTKLFLKGAPEVIINRCADQLTGEQRQPIDRPQALKLASELASQGKRIIACAMKENLPADKITIDPNDETELTFLGLIGLEDSPRAQVKESIAACHTASIQVVMITGDHPITAVSIAKKIGIIANNQTDESLNTLILTGKQLRGLSDFDFQKIVKNIRIYARVAPEDKIRIVTALQAAGEFVAMTGDGVNDAPALKRADIGVAMGKGGTDVARESAQMILLDDNFSTIVHAVTEGRRIFDNIRKFIRYVLTGNSGEIWTLLIAQIIGLPLPLLPIQILFVNLLTDGLPGMALAAEPSEKGTMTRPPRPPSESVFARGLWQHSLIIGMALGALTLFAFKLGSVVSITNGQTMAFMVLTSGQLIHILAIRSESESIFRRDILSNKQLTVAVFLTFGIQVFAIYNPKLNTLFGTCPLTPEQMALCIGLAACILIFTEAERLFQHLVGKRQPITASLG